MSEGLANSASIPAVQRFASKNDSIGTTERLHPKHPDPLLDQTRHDQLSEAAEVGVHQVQWHLDGIEREKSATDAWTPLEAGDCWAIARAAAPPKPTAMAALIKLRLCILRTPINGYLTPPALARPWSIRRRGHRNVRRHPVHSLEATCAK